MEDTNQRISELLAAITKESDTAKILRLNAELNRLLAQKLEKNTPPDPTAETA